MNKDCEKKLTDLLREYSDLRRRFRKVQAENDELRTKIVTMSASLKTRLENMSGMDGEVSPKDKKELLVFLHNKLKDCNILKRSVLKKALSESIPFLGALPESAKRYPIQSYIDFLQEAEEKGQLKNLGE